MAFTCLQQEMNNFLTAQFSDCGVQPRPLLTSPDVSSEDEDDSPTSGQIFGAYKGGTAANRTGHNRPHLR
jgi:hypothetical protein